MTLEIRELVIEARVVDDRSQGQKGPRETGMTVAEQARWVELVTRRVLDVLHEQRERQ
ncbi:MULTISPECIES: DUF5908 family protein [Serratia]|uniref:DUF5908 family protein n=1 Tax=Serratia TaxID=613 RepID=UPI0013D9A2B9|nr:MULTISPECIES: DUF5908 family protein [Serratia]MBH2656207.1 hypothetical protein [Serratia ureilytica]MBJ2092191.1 hypothetical protein [Serratia ureilytica]HBC5194897.1 hypothetical protein [Serratia marcescens]